MKVVVKVFDKLTGGKREKDRIHQDGDEFIELFLQPGDAYEMNGVGWYRIWLWFYVIESLNTTL